MKKKGKKWKSFQNPYVFNASPFIVNEVTKQVANQLIWGNHRNLIICAMNPSKRQGNSKHISNQIVIFKAQMKQARFY